MKAHTSTILIATAFVLGTLTGSLLENRSPRRAPVSAAGDPTAPAVVPNRTASILAPGPGDSHRTVRLRVKRAVEPGTAPVEYEPVGRDGSGGVAVLPGEWFVVVDGKTYLLTPDSD